tara:strand:+ start:3162 stop:3335 length:174 start_codon:yes stop_codon:yes gene_type:complete
MKNKHIELVKKWLADNDSVSRGELVTNAEAARADDCTADASYWVKKYEKLENSLTEA